MELLNSNIPSRATRIFGSFPRKAPTITNLKNNLNVAGIDHMKLARPRREYR